MNVERCWRGLEHAAAVVAAAAQIAWNWRYFVVHIAVACIVADYTAAAHTAAADASWASDAVAAAYDVAADNLDGAGAAKGKTDDDVGRDVLAVH